MSSGLNIKFYKKINLPALLYICAGSMLFILLLLTFNSYVLNLKVETAVVNAPLEPITSPIAGYIAEIFVVPNTIVKRGMPLFKIENFDLEKEWQLARLQAEDAKVHVSYLQQLLNNEQQRLIIYKDIGSNRVASAQALVDIAKRESSIAEKNLARMRKLHEHHYLSEVNWDNALTNVSSAKEKLNSALAQMNLENSSLQSVQNGMYFTGNKLEGKEKDINAELTTARNRLTVSLNRVKVYEDFVRKLTLTAPFDGKVIQVLKSAGNSTDTTKTVILIEKLNTNKEIIAYLTQNEIMSLRLNGKVKVYIPSLNHTFHGTISNINRTAGFVDEMNAQYRWRDLYSDRSGTVTITISANEQIHFNEKVISGMPAIIYFPRKFFLF